MSSFPLGCWIVTKVNHFHRFAFAEEQNCDVYVCRWMEETRDWWRGGWKEVEGGSSKHRITCGIFCFCVFICFRYVNLYFFLSSQYFVVLDCLHAWWYILFHQRDLFWFFVGLTVTFCWLINCEPVRKANAIWKMNKQTYCCLFVLFIMILSR